MLLEAVSIVCATSMAALFMSIKRNLEFMEKIDELQESIQKTVDILEEHYKIIEKKTKIEVFSDEPIVKELIRDINAAKNAVLSTAKLLDDTIDVESFKDSE